MNGNSILDKTFSNFQIKLLVTITSHLNDNSLPGETFSVHYFTIEW